MMNFFNSNSNYPPGPSGGPGSYNNTPYPPIGFNVMPMPNFESGGGGGAYPPPSNSGSSSFYPPSGPRPYDSYPNSNMPPAPQGGGFPIAPPNSSYGYVSQPGAYGGNAPPQYGGGYPPAQAPPPTQAPYQPTQSYPSYATHTQPTSNLYPNLNAPMGGGGGGYGPTSGPVNFNTNPTVRPHQPFNAYDDATRLYKAMKGLGTDETALIDVLCKRTSQQRLEIVMAYKASYGKDLIRNIESETSGEFRNLLVALLKHPIMLEAEYLRDSVQGLGTNEAHLIDVVCTKSNSQMLELKRTYHQMYHRNAEEDVRDDVSGYFKRLLVSLMAGQRQENAPVDFQKAQHQARELYGAGERKFGTDEVVFNRIFAVESFPQLRAIFDEYQKLARHPIENAIRSEMSSSVERAFLTLIQFIRNPAAFYAQRLHESMAGLGTRDTLLIRIMVLRSEIDMQDIKMEFQRRFGKTLESFIRSDTSGDYRRGLLCLAGDPKWK